jgi:hypothetical protein
MADNKIEQYLIDFMVNYREVESNLWLIEDDEHYLEGVALVLAEPLVIMRTTVMDVPQGQPPERQLELFTKLLELNATDVAHGAYAIEEGKIILIDTLEYETMDFPEFRASLEAFSLALTQHYKILSGYRK